MLSKSLKVYINGEHKFNVELVDSPMAQEVSWGLDPLDNSAIIIFEIADVYPGSKYKDTAITELILNGGY